MSIPSRSSAADERSGHAAQHRSAGDDAEPHPDHPTQRGEADPDGRSRPQDPVKKGARDSHRRADVLAQDQQYVARQHLYDHLSRHQPESAEAGGAVAGVDLCRIESRRARKDTESARKFLEKEIAGYEKKLEEAEARLKEFKMRNMATQNAEGKDYFADERPPALLEQSKLELREAEQSRDALKRQIVGDEPSLLPDAPGAIAGISVPELDARIDALQRNLDAMLQRYTDKHPDVVRRVV
jgi:hypothetical protein